MRSATACRGFFNINASKLTTKTTYMGPLQVPYALAIVRSVIPEMKKLWWGVEHVERAALRVRYPFCLFYHVESVLILLTEQEKHGTGASVLARKRERPKNQ